MSYEQNIEKAVVYAGGGFRVYVPYSGRLTQGKQHRMDRLFSEYALEKKLLGGGLPPNWKTKNVVITRHDDGGLDSYSEDGGGGVNRCYVCFNPEFETKVANIWIVATNS